MKRATVTLSDEHDDRLPADPAAQPVLPGLAEVRQTAFGPPLDERTQTELVARAPKPPADFFGFPVFARSGVGGLGHNPDTPSAETLEL